MNPAATETHQEGSPSLVTGTPERIYFTTEQLANRWGKNPETVRRLVRQKMLRPIRGLGCRPYQFHICDILEFERKDEFIDKRELLRRARTRMRR